MPIYEYHCNNCECDFEYLVIGNSHPDCPSCNSKKVKKLMSTCGYVSKSKGGSTRSSASSSSCGGCSATSCAGCGH